MANNQSDFILFKTEDDKISVDVRFEDETVWLSQEQMAALFGKGRSTITEHIGNVYNEGELEQNRTCRKFRQVRQEGTREVVRELDYYNLDVIISVGYRVKSLRGTQFRIWATKRLNEYIRKGFTMDDERLKNLNSFGIFGFCRTSGRTRTGNDHERLGKAFGQNPDHEWRKTIAGRWHNQSRNCN